MIFEQVPIGGDKNLGYLVGDATTRQVAAVDPGMNPHALSRRAEEIGATITLILATHSHSDHVAGVPELKRITQNPPFAAHPDVRGIDRALNDGEILKVGDLSIRVLHCPGHCADSIVYLIDEYKALVGDELFVGGVGKSWNEDQARVHFLNLHGVLLGLDDDVEVFPGHDYGIRPFSTIGEQRTSNPFLVQPDFESFWHLRQNWKQYVKAHDIPWGG